MKINTFEIDKMGGLILWEMEPNIPELPDIDGVEVNAYLFDGYGVFTHDNKYYKISYDKLEDVRDDEQVRRTINAHRYGNRLPNDYWDITVDDLALCFGEVEACEYAEYVSYIIDGLVDNVSNLNVEDGEREVLSPDECANKLREIEKCPPKYLYYFTDLNDLGEQFDGKIFSVSDETGEHICDVLQDDLIELEKQGIINNDATLTSEMHREKLLSTRFEAIVFLKDE